MLISSIRKRVAEVIWPPPPNAAPASPSAVLDAYVAGAPSPELAIELFRGEWSSRLPAPLDGIAAGQAPLFDDARIKWLSDEIGGFAGKRVLELGPLEGGHTYMLERGGAHEIVAVESNTRAYLKCLVMKELLGINRARFLLGDFVEYLRNPGDAFDVCVASGVLYHMRQPVELLALLSRACRRDLLLWTHYYDEAAIQANPTWSRKFHDKQEMVVEGFSHTLRRYQYGDALGWKGFCGGSAHYSYWMRREDILGALDHFGFGNVRINYETKEHPNGPSFALVASKR